MTESTLTREVGVFGATMMGLGSMVGTGVFVSIGVAAGVIGPAVILSYCPGGARRHLQRAKQRAACRKHAGERGHL